MPVRASSGETVDNSQPVNSKRREAKEGRTSFHSRIWWAGTAVRDHLCVTDLCTAIDLVLYEDVPGQAYNVGKKIGNQGLTYFPKSDSFLSRTQNLVL